MRSILGVAAIMAAIVGVAAFQHAKTAPDAAPAPKPVLDDSAVELPAGVRDGWFAALDHAIDHRLSVYRRWLVIRDNDLSDQHTLRYVPLSGVILRCQSVPFEVGLEATGTSADSDGDLVAGFAATFVSDVQGMSDETLPPLGVGPRSPAAQGLLDELCRHLADRVDMNPSSAIRGAP